MDRWKEVSGFSLLQDGGAISDENTKPFIELPRLNIDLIDQELMNKVTPIGKYLPLNDCWNVVLKLGVEEDTHFIYVEEKIWTFIKAHYPEAIEIKRPIYENSNGLKSYDLHGHIVIFDDLR